MKDIAELSQIKRKTSPCPADIPLLIKERERFLQGGKARVRCI